jgi:MATE family multidrug resistance protein
MSSALEQVRRTLTLALPMVIGSVATQLMHIVDMAMVGRVGVTELAAGTFATNVFGIFWFFGIGLVNAISVLVGEAHGAENDHKARHVMRHGYIVSALLSLVLGGLLAAMVQFTEIWHLSQPPEVIEVGRGYLLMLALSMAPLMLFITQKSYCEARDKPWDPLWFNLGAILLNVFLNWILIYGNLGMPALGLTGAGIATVLARFMTMFLFGFWLRRRSGMSLRWTRSEWTKIDWPQAKELTWLGIPIGLQVFFEVAAFNCAVFMMGWLPEGKIAIAAHSIALNYAALAFMVPLGIMFAAVVRVGQARGAGRMKEAQTIGWTTIGVSASFMAIMACVYALGRNWLPYLYLDDSVGEGAEAVLQLASVLMLFAAALAVFDGIQVISVGVLRGYRDVVLPTFVTLVGFWFVCLPLGLWLGFRLDGSENLPAFLQRMVARLPEGLGWGAPGVWAGLCLGMFPTSVAMALRFWTTSRRAVREAAT